MSVSCLVQGIQHPAVQIMPVCKSEPSYFPITTMKAMVDPFKVKLGEDLTDLSSLFEHLLSHDEHNVNHLVNINIGCKTRRGPMKDLIP